MTPETTAFLVRSHQVVIRHYHRLLATHQFSDNERLKIEDRMAKEQAHLDLLELEHLRQPAPDRVQPKCRVAADC